MKVNVLCKAKLWVGAVILLVTSSVANASAATPDHGRRMPEKPVVGRSRPPGTVGVDDLLRISVQGAPEFSGRYRVDPDGGIDYPFMGRLTVSGLKPEKIAELIRDGLKKADTRVHKVLVELEPQQEPRK